MLLGLFLIVLGVLLLLKNLGLVVLPASIWAILYPVILIALGFWFISIVQRGRAYKHWMVNKYWGRKDNDEM